ncbi:hypothetical protein AB1Y20_016079 [Prymnesium parvum]|uniref:Uncharacterized protein n=1 Tax=Prymnesium parvum TaxID=97485 RepID=A0AB34JW72_PRYPA
MTATHASEREESHSRSLAKYAQYYTDHLLSRACGCFAAPPPASAKPAAAAAAAAASGKSSDSASATQPDGKPSRAPTTAAATGAPKKETDGGAVCPLPAASNKLANAVNMQIAENRKKRREEAAAKMRAAIMHQVWHRAQEKFSFGMAELTLEHVLEASLERGVGHIHAVHASWSVWSLVTGGLHAFKILIPMSGAYLLSRMTHHDLHRAQHELHDDGFTLATLLFFLATIFDALDALTHSLVALLMFAEVVVDHDTLHRLHLDSHFAHELHFVAMVCGIGAIATMVAGEAASMYLSLRKPSVEVLNPAKKKID